MIDIFKQTLPWNCRGQKIYPHEIFYWPRKETRVV